MAFDRLATKYSRSARTVASFGEVENLVRESFPFEVLKLPCNGVLQGEAYKTRFCSLHRDDTGEPVGESSVSPKYVPHTLEDVCTLLEAARQAFDGELSVDCFWQDAHILVVKPTQEAFFELYSQERIIPKLAIDAGFAGKAFKASLGFYNSICSNLAILSSVYNVSRSIRHTLSMRDRLDALVTDFQTVRGSWQETQATIARMNAKRVIVADVIRDVFGDIPDKGKGRTQAENRIEKIISRVYRECQENGLQFDGKTTSGWRLWNALQGALQHDFTRKETDPTLRALATWNDQDLFKLERTILAS